MLCKGQVDIILISLVGRLHAKAICWLSNMQQHQIKAFIIE